MVRVNSFVEPSMAIKVKSTVEWCLAMALVRSPWCWCCPRRGGSRGMSKTNTCYSMRTSTLIPNTRSNNIFVIIL